MLYKAPSLHHHTGMKFSNRNRAAMGILAACLLATHPVLAAPSCHTLVTLFGQPICTEQLGTQDPAIGPPPPVSPLHQMMPVDAAGQDRLKTRDRLKAKIWETALIKRFGTAAIVPTAAEIDDYRQTFNESMRKSYESDKKTADFIAGLLQKNEYLPENRQKLANLLNATQMSVKFYEERQNHTAALPKEYQFVVDTAEKTIASGMLEAWKGDKALYQAYGGRLVFERSGFVPIDAYKMFVTYIRTDGHLAIVDPAYNDVLKITEDDIAADHRTVPPGADMYRNYFSSPTWQFTFGNSAARFDSLKKGLLAIPTLGPKTGAPVDEKQMVGKSSLPPSPY